MRPEAGRVISRLPPDAAATLGRSAMRKFVRLSLVAGASAAVIGGAMVASPTFAAGPGGGECQLDGTANFNPGPGANPTGAFSYNFGGTLSGCNSSEAGAPAGGQIHAGQPITYNGATV